MKKLPNLLTLLRIFSVAPLAFLMAKKSWCVAALLYAAAALTDFLDGFLARRLNAQTAAGKLLDPAADKALLLIPLALLALGKDAPAYLKLLFWTLLFKDLLIVGGSIYLLKKKIVPAPIGAGKVAVALAMAAILFYLWERCLGKADLFSKTTATLAALLTIVALVLYTREFLKIRKELWERRSTSTE